MLLILVILAYFMFIVWSAAQEVKESSYPNLMRYSGALKGEELPLPKQNLGGPQGMPMSAPPQMGPPRSMGPPMPMSAPPMYGSMGPPMGGMPQSFVPAPMSGSMRA